MQRLNRELRRVLDFESMELEQQLMANERGYTREEIRNIKLVKIEGNMLDQYKSTSCTICLNDFKQNDKARILNCNHAFH